MGDESITNPLANCTWCLILPAHPLLGCTRDPPHVTDGKFLGVTPPVPGVAGGIGSNGSYLGAPLIGETLIAFMDLNNRTQMEFLAGDANPSWWRDVYMKKGYEIHHVRTASRGMSNRISYSGAYACQDRTPHPVSSFGYGALHSAVAIVLEQYTLTHFCHHTPFDCSPPDGLRVAHRHANLAGGDRLQRSWTGTYGAIRPLGNH